MKITLDHVMTSAAFSDCDNWEEDHLYGERLSVPVVILEKGEPKSVVARIDDKPFTINAIRELLEAMEYAEKLASV